MTASGTSEGRRRAKSGLGRQALIPVLAFLFYGALKLAESSGIVPGPALALPLILPVLLAAMIAAVSYAEKFAHSVGEPFGTLVLTLAVTVIEVALIMPIAFGGKGEPALARDTVFSVIMIVCNGLAGLCILAGGIRYREQDFEVKGASTYLSVLTALSVLILILPDYTSSTPGPTLARAQLFFVAIVTLLLYAVFLYIQTVRHRDYFVANGGPLETASSPHTDAPVPFWKISLLLIVSLFAAVLLSKAFAASLKTGLTALGAPGGLAGLSVALLVLLPESVTALRAARANELQRSINLALGSSLATIGLTVPAVAGISLYLGRDLTLGLDPQAIVLLTLTLVLSVLTFGTGRTNILYGFVHLIVFATYILLIFLP
jgi:Ca2+:H+ antiporter